MRILSLPLAAAMLAAPAHASRDFDECVAVGIELRDEGHAPWETDDRIMRLCDKVVQDSGWIPSLPLRRSF